MMSHDDIVKISSGAGFERKALELFKFQATACPPYARYVNLLGMNPEDVCSVEDIPFMPIGFFKSHYVYSHAEQPEIVFTSSTTGGGEPARHPMRSLAGYETAFNASFSHFYGPPADYSFYALLPGYLEREGSSLVYMADRLIKQGGGGFYLYDTEGMLRDMAGDKKKKILLGVSYALLDLAENRPGALPGGTVVMETGGMKGKREEMPKHEFHGILKDAFGVRSIHSEYGMAELTSQAYSVADGVFNTPPWMRVMVRDLNDPFAYLPDGAAGGINIIDLANVHSCAFIQTEDLGKVTRDGFSVLGRIDHSEIRGCNLLVQGSFP